MNKTIGFVGFKQVGKSTASKYLEDNYGFVRLNFKDGLLEEIKNNFPDLLTYFLHLYKCQDIKELFDTKPEGVRCLLQNYGTEVRRRDKHSYWVDRWKHTHMSNAFENYVTDDVRFLNEAQAVRDMGGILIRLTRPDITSGGSHTSETEQLDIVTDYTIECEQGGHEKLYKQLDNIIREMLLLTTVSFTNKG